jgi:hypothetical protein
MPGRRGTGHLAIRPVPDNGLALIFALKSGTGPVATARQRDYARRPTRFKIII